MSLETTIKETAAKMRREDELERMSSAEFRELLLSRKTWRIFYCKGSPNNMRFHIRAVVDGQIVYRYWSYRKKRWIYDIECIWFFYFRREKLLP